MVNFFVRFSCTVHNGNIYYYYFNFKEYLIITTILSSNIYGGFEYG